MKRLNLSLEEWEEIYYPDWYRVGINYCSSVRTTDISLANSLGGKIEHLGKIEKQKPK